MRIPLPSASASPESGEAVLRRYGEFVEQVDRLCADLAGRYAGRMVCRPGCSDCCTAISVLPVEAAVIADWLAARGLPVGRPNAASGSPDLAEDRPCAFLSRGLCGIYPIRPLICRSHGLPLLYLIEEYELDGRPAAPDSPEWRMAWCELNFTDVGEEELEQLFTPGTILNMEELNRRLAALNEEFLATPRGGLFPASGRVTLEQVFEPGA
jgi:Fe-S-cluster containining protein